MACGTRTSANPVVEPSIVVLAPSAGQSAYAGAAASSAAVAARSSGQSLMACKTRGSSETGAERSRTLISLVPARRLLGPQREALDLQVIDELPYERDRRQ